MKKQSIIRMLAIFIVFAMLIPTLVACKDAIPGPQGEQGIQGESGKDGVTPTIEISADGYWVINGVKTEYKAVGQDGKDGEKGDTGADGTDGDTPVVTISADGYWIINGVKTEYKAVGQDGDKGDKGDKGDPGDTPTVAISEDGYWIINGVKTSVKAVGKDGENGAPGETPTIAISDDGYWVINGVKTTTKALGEDGEKGDPGETPEITISDDGYWVINGVKTTTKALGTDGAPGAPGKTPTIEISDDGYWVIDGVKSEVKAVGKDGENGAPGETPTIAISEDGYWIINGVITKFKAIGVDGVSPVISISDDGYWVINGEKTEYKAVCHDCDDDVNNTPEQGSSGFVMPEGGYDGSAVTIRFYHQMGASLKAILDAAIADFNKIYPNITIEHRSLGDYNGVRDQIKKEIAVGNQPHLAYCYLDHVALYNKENAVQTLDVFINDENVGFTQAELDDFVEAFYNEGRMLGDGMMYSLPISKSTEVLYYNKTFFEEHDLEIPTTWEEMEEVCRRIKEIDPDSIPLGYDSESNWFITMCEQYGSDYTSATGQKYLFNNQTNIDFVTMFRTWYQNKWVTTVELSGGYTSSLFTGDGSNSWEGSEASKGTRCYMSIGSTGGAAYMQPTLTNGQFAFEVGIASIPQVNPAEPKVISQGPSICMFKQENPQEMIASWLFMQFLTTDHTFQGSCSMSNGYAPVIKSVSNNPTYAEFLAKADVNGTANITAYAVKVAIEQQDAYFALPTFIGSSVARDQVGLLLQKVFTLPAEGLTEAIQKAFEDAVDECEYQAPSEIVDDGGIVLPPIPIGPGIPEEDETESGNSLLTLKQLRFNISEYVGEQVAFEGVITYNSDYTAFIQDYDSETGMYFGMQIFYGYDSSLIEVLAPGNRVRIVGTLGVYQGVYQVSSLTYNPMRPDDPANTTLISTGNEIVYSEVTADEYSSYITVGGELIPAKKLVVSTAISMKNLVVADVNVSSNGEMTLTCDLDGQTVEVRTAFSEEKLPESAEAYFLGQTIDVRGLVDYYDPGDTGNGTYQIKVYLLSDITIH